MFFVLKKLTFSSLGGLAYDKPSSLTDKYSLFSDVHQLFVAQWIGCLPAIREVVGSNPTRSIYFFFIFKNKFLVLVLTNYYY